MKQLFFSILSVCAATCPVVAQNDLYSSNNQNDDEFGPAYNRKVSTDSLGSNKEIPKGLKVWTIDERFGDQKAAEVDTMQYMYMNSTFTSGLRGEYNTLGNMGSPRINRIFIDRPLDQGQFLFTQPYDFIITPISDFHFTNTYSPITNVTLNSCGNRTNGEDDFKALFAVNAGKRLGVGFRFDYKYGRGYYSSQSTSHFKYTMWGSYLGDRYQAHILFSTLHQKVSENGGITNDDYINHPELFEQSFAENEIPTVLERNWNRNDNLHVFLTHRYNVGFNRKVRMTDEEIKAKKFAMESQKDNAAEDAKEAARKKAKQEGKKFDEKAYDRNSKQKTYSGRPDDAKIAGNEPALDSNQMAKNSPKADTTRISVDGKAAADSLLAIKKKAAEDSLWLKNEYVPVTSFIHTLKFDNYKRIYQAYETPDNFYQQEYYNVGELTGDSIYDKTRHIRGIQQMGQSRSQSFRKL